MGGERAGPCKKALRSFINFLPLTVKSSTHPLRLWKYIEQVAFLVVICIFLCIQMDTLIYQSLTQIQLHGIGFPASLTNSTRHQTVRKPTRSRRASHARTLNRPPRPLPSQCRLQATRARTAHTTTTAADFVCYCTSRQKTGVRGKAKQSEAYLGAPLPRPRS